MKFNKHFKATKVNAVLLQFRAFKMFIFTNIHLYSPKSVVAANNVQYIKEQKRRILTNLN